MRWLLLVLVACSSRAETPSAAQEPAPAPVPAVPRAEKYAATQILVSWAGAVGAPVTVTRSEPEAEALARQLHATIVAGASIEDLARTSSDGLEARRGGHLGSYLPGTMVPAFEDAVAAVPVGGVTEPFRTPFGWHVVRRDPVEQIHLEHVLVSYAGAWRSGSTRTKDEARARAEQAWKRIESGEDFAAVARELSDDPTSTVGGDLGVVERGQLVPAVEDAGFALAPGAHSGIVESPYGFHVIERLPDGQ